MAQTTRGPMLAAFKLAFILLVASLFFIPSTFPKAQETTTTTVTETQTTGANETTYTPSQIIAEILGGMPTDPNLKVSVTVQRYDIYLFSEDGMPYASLWMEARVSAPGASDLAVHQVFQYRGTNNTEIGTIIPSVTQLAQMLNQDPALGLVFREWSQREDRGSIIVLQPTTPGDFSDARLVFGYYGPLDNASVIENIEKVYVVLVAYGDTQAGLWNAAIQEAPLRIIRAEPPDKIKDAIEEGKGLPQPPSSAGTGTPYSPPISEETQETRVTVTVPSQTITVTTTISMATGMNDVNEYEEEEENNKAGAVRGEEGKQENEKADYEEKAANKEGNENEKGNEGGVEGEGKEAGEGEGANLPTREIAIAIVIAAVGGVALSFIRRK